MNIDEFLETYPNNIADLAEQMRTFIKALAPDSNETLHVGWRVISFDRQRKFCAIAPHADWVNLQLHEGATLEDPENLLEGSGQSMRHVKIRDVTNLSEALRELVRQAIVQADQPS